MEACRDCDTPIGGEAVELNLREPMGKGEATLFRRGAARIDYLSQDRPDLNVASRLLAMRMADPRRGDEVILKRVLRYLKGNPRSVYQYPWGGDSTDLTVYTDSDWAGDREKRRSTSGGVIIYGGHLVGHWSKLQASPAPSSGEAELNAATKGLSEVIGVKNSLEQIGIAVNLHHYVDASAAKGTMLRQGAGKIKHLEARQLWCQVAVERHRGEVIKIPRKINLADNLTHPVGRRDLGLFHDAVGVRVGS